MWPCPKCNESIDDNFHVCWRCGTLRDGTEDPTFVAVEEIVAHQEPRPGRPGQMSLAGLFLLTALVGITLGLFVDTSGRLFGALLVAVFFVVVKFCYDAFREPYAIEEDSRERGDKTN